MSKETKKRNPRVAVGNRYNMLVVVERKGTKVTPKGQKKPLWLCLCDCGNTTEVTSQPLTDGTTKSCGCLKLGPRVDYSGIKQGMLTVVERAEDTVQANGVNVFWWLCRCDCGNEVTLRGNAIKAGASSCGCNHRRGNTDAAGQITHGHTVGGHSPTYTTWHSMMQRCLNENHESYKLYGAKGITVCEKWRSFEGFLEDMGVRPENTSLNRINGAPLYSKDTCEWATLSVQGYDQKKRSTNTSGRTGVSFNKTANKWEAYIDCDRRIHLGLHETFDGAVNAREEAELKYFGRIKE